jgi:hypothetical protein
MDFPKIPLEKKSIKERTVQEINILQYPRKDFIKYISQGQLVLAKDP